MDQPSHEKPALLRVTKINEVTHTITLESRPSIEDGIVYHRMSRKAMARINSSLKRATK